MKYVMALDQGTTSSRAVIIGSDGKIVSVSQNEFTQIFPHPGWVEHDPEKIIESQFAAMREALQKSGLSVPDISAIGIANQRETTIVWDRETGLPVYNAIVWQCRRTAQMCEELKKSGLEEYIRDKTGLLADAYFSATKISWILNNVPGAREKAEQGKLLFGTVDTWLIWNLTKGAAHVTDYSNASRTMLFDIHNLKWDEYLCKKLDIPMCMLPEVKPSSCIYGKVAPKVAGIEEFEGVPIAGAAGDQPSALFGQACFEPGMVKNTYGTGCFFLMNTGGKIVKSQNSLLSSAAWGIDGKVVYALEGSVFNAGSVIKWLRDKLGIIKTSRECDILAESVADTGGVYFVPAFTGLGAPYWDMYAKGTIIGITGGTGREHIARSVLESISYQVKDLMEAIEGDTEIKINELRVDGGASVSNFLMQFQADMLDIPVNRPQSVETTAYGAAFLAGLAAGVWKSTDEISRFRKADRIFTPNMPDSKRQELYGKWKRAVERSKNWF